MHEAKIFALSLLVEITGLEGALQDIVEKTVGGLTIRIDRLLCVGFGDCIEVAPGLFEFDADGIVAFKRELAEPDRETLITACDICPVDALIVIDENGTQIVP